MQIKVRKILQKFQDNYGIGIKVKSEMLQSGLAMIEWKTKNYLT